MRLLPINLQQLSNSISLTPLQIITLLLLSIINISFIQTCYAQTPPIQLATSFREDIQIEQYYVSEKLDGIRAYWNGNKLISKQGNTFTAPAWFTQSFPPIALDGELWIKRNSFEKVSGIVRTQDKNNEQWHQVTFMIFDMPQSKAPFKQRVKLMKNIVKSTSSDYLKMIAQFKINTNKKLFSLLDNVVSNKGEGLMLHHQDALYQVKRSKDLMKLKKFNDAEAIVIAHTPGKGKYKGQLGAILVQTKEGITFKIGSGFSDKERQNPPPIGSTITYRYTGKTKNNIPRFASFMRVRVIY